MITIDRHPERDDRDEGEVAGDVEDVVRGCKRVCREQQKDAGQYYRDRDPEGLSRGQPGEQRKSCALDVVVELNFHQ
jgi:hypothetical protein